MTQSNEQDQALEQLLAEVKQQAQLARNTDSNNNLPSNRPTRTWSPTPPEPEVCVSAVVQTGANLPLAAERLCIPEEQLIAIISTDPAAPGQLMAQMRTMATIKAMATLNIVETELQGKIPLMDPYDLSKTYTALLDKVVTATDRNEHTENINVTQVALGMLPPAARAAMKSLMDEINNPESGTATDYDDGRNPNDVPNTVIDNYSTDSISNSDNYDDVYENTKSTSLVHHVDVGDLVGLDEGVEDD